MAHVKIPLPVKGIHKGGAVESEVVISSGYMNNVRARDVLENRVRLGQRPGLNKWGDGDLIGSGSPVVAMCTVSSRV